MPVLSFSFLLFIQNEFYIMRPEQRTSFRIFAATSLLLTTGCEAIHTFRSSSSVYGAEPTPLSSPLPIQPQSTEFMQMTSEIQGTETPIVPIPVTGEAPTLAATATVSLEPFTLSPESPVRLDKENTTHIIMQLGTVTSDISFVPKKWNQNALDFKTLCPVGKEFGCTFSSDNRTFIFIDSGLYDDKPLAAEPYRNYIERGYPMRTPEERTQHLAEFVGEQVTIQQYNGSWTGEVLAAIYIPHEHVAAFTKDLAKGPDVILSLYPEYASAVQNGIVYIEFCGWDMSLKGDERWTGTRYVLILGTATKNPQ